MPLTETMLNSKCQMLNSYVLFLLLFLLLCSRAHGNWFLLSWSAGQFSFSLCNLLYLVLAKYNKFKNK